MLEIKIAFILEAKGHKNEIIISPYLFMLTNTCVILVYAIRVLHTPAFESVYETLIKVVFLQIFPELLLNQSGVLGD